MHVYAHQCTSLSRYDNVFLEVFCSCFGQSALAHVHAQTLEVQHLGYLFYSMQCHHTAYGRAAGFTKQADVFDAFVSGKASQPGMYIPAQQRS
jgi:hypothetical protein